MRSWNRIWKEYAVNNDHLELVIWDWRRSYQGTVVNTRRHHNRHPGRSTRKTIGPMCPTQGSLVGYAAREATGHQKARIHI